MGNGLTRPRSVDVTETEQSTLREAVTRFEGVLRRVQTRTSGGCAGFDTCTRPSTTTPAWPTPRSSPMRAGPPVRPFGDSDEASSAHGIVVERVMTDNAFAYRGRLFDEALAEHRILHRYCRPSRLTMEK